MKLQRNRTLSTIALILILTFSVFMATMPAAKAQSTPPPGVPSIPTYALIVVVPNPVGVGQTASIGFWLDKVPPTAAGPYGDRWQNMTVTLTNPDGTTQTFGPYTSDPVGQHYFEFVPTTVGTYYFQFSFPGQRITGIGAQIPIPIDNYYQPSTSPKVALTVQQQPIQAYPAAPLPTGYWTRPIEGYNREWYTISGNWLGLGSFLFGQGSYNASGNLNPYTTAPNSAHIVWTKPIAIGGLMGGEFGGGGTSSYNWGNTYEPMFVPPVILNGVLYYNAPVPPREGFYAVDLRTGETLWWQNGTGPITQLGGVGLNGYYAIPGITLGQIYNYISPNQYGGSPYLWFTKATTWYMYDAGTGNLILSIANATNLGNPQTPGTVVEGPNGELLIYLLGNSRLVMWNSSLCIGTLGTTSTAVWCWRPEVGATLDWNRGIQWNASIPNMGPFLAVSHTDGNVILATTGNLFLPQNWQMEVGYSAIDGHVLWTQNRTTPAGATAFNLNGPMQDGVYTEFHQSETSWYGYDVLTGKQLWGPTEPYINAWGFYDSTASIAYGKLYATGYDGTVHAYDVKTGTHLWDWYAGSSGYETAYGTWPLSIVGSLTIADGKIYVGASHGLVQPMFRGGQLYCIDANSGNELWRVNTWCGSTLAVADGYLVTLNGYDNQIYCYGKGLTATTVSAAPGVGNVVTIQGTVTDQSSGAKGTPAISDQDMTAWMEYLYMQQPIPDHANGVPVTLTAVDSNHNTSNIGTATSDNAGLFHIAWTPPATGEYTIIASFGGSNSYFASSAETGLAVAASTSSSSTSSSAPLDLYIIVATIVIVIAIAIAVIILRRRK
jgi:outer membrane protein assembly factor BamB